MVTTRVSITGESDGIVTRNSEFKALVRKRMEITGESYTQAMRHILLAASVAVPRTGAEAGQPPPTLQRRVFRPWNPPQTELPAVVPMDPLQLARTEQAAIAITAISAYTQGFDIFMTRWIRPGVRGPRWIRPDVPGVDEDPTPEMLNRRRMDPLSAPLFSLLFSDGTKVVPGTAQMGEAQPAGPILHPHGGGSTLHHEFLRWWACPLPPKGPLEFVCQWSMYGIAETRVGIDAQLILDAAQRSVRLWPEDEG